MENNIEITSDKEINITTQDNEIQIENLENDIQVESFNNTIEIESADTEIQIIVEGKGKDGIGLIDGGTTGQILAKKSNDDFDTEWVNQTGGSGEPQVQSDYEQTDNTKVDYIKNKPTIPSKVGDLIIDIDTDDIPATSTNLYVPTLPTDNPTSLYLNGNKEWATVTGGVTDHTELTNLNGDSDYQHITTDEKSLVTNSVQSVNNITAIEGDVTLTADDVGALPDNTVIPVNHSDLSNLDSDNDYQHLTLTQKEMIGRTKGIVNSVDDLPTESEEGDLYFVTEHTPQTFGMDKTYTKMFINQNAPTPTSLGFTGNSTYESDFICSDGSPLYVLAYGTDVLGYEALNIAMALPFDEVNNTQTIINYLKFFENCTATIFSEQNYKTGWNYQVTVVDGNNVVISDLVTQIDPDIDIFIEKNYEASSLTYVDRLSQIVTPNKMENPTLYIYYNGTWVKANNDIYKEDKSNKVTIINSSSTDGQYPSAKAVYTTVNALTPEPSLKLDQTTPQTVTGGMPNFDGGLKVDYTTVGATYYATNSPITYGGYNGYVPDDFSCFWYKNGESSVPFFLDDGVVTPQLIGFSSSTPTINVCMFGLPDGEGGYAATATGYSDLDEANLLLFVQSVFEQPLAEILYFEPAFTYNETTGEFDNVMTVDVCEPSANTTWTNPAELIGRSGFIVEPDAKIIHTTDYTNSNPSSKIKTKGQIIVGDGNLVDISASPVISNPLFDQEGLGLEFAMTFVPEILREGGTPSAPLSSSVYVSGIYGTTAITGTWTRFNGTAIGIWSAIQNSLGDGGGVELDYGVAFKGGVTFASATGETLIIKDLACFKSDFTNLNQGKTSSTNIKHFEVGSLQESENYHAETINNYGLYIVDNSNNYVTNSWGIYSLEPKNYVKGLEVDGGFIGNVTNVTNTYQILDTDYTIVCNKSSNFAVTLPTGIIGQIFKIKNINAGIVTVSASGQTIDGQASQLVYQWDCMQIQCVDTNTWIIL